MKILVIYAYPVESDGQSLQGDLLRRGIIENGDEAIPCNYRGGYQKKFYLKHLKPDVAIGIGYWGNIPEVVKDPLKYGITPVPWFNADGWVANYKKEFEQLKLMFTTSEWVKSIYDRDGIDVSKIIPMHIGIDTDLFKPNENDNHKKAIRGMLGIKEDEKMILTAGGDVTSKGAQEMFKALAQVDKDIKNWRYVCKSWPSDCAAEWHVKEQELVNELGIGDKVIFIDDEFSPEFMAHLINACDIYAAPSRIEGFGMIQIEAMACGKPVISINKMGPSETIVHNKTGFLAGVAEEIWLDGEWIYPHMGFEKEEFIKFSEPKIFGYRADVEDLRKYTLNLLTDPELCGKMGKEGRQHAVKNFDYKITSKKMIDTIKERLGIE